MDHLVADFNTALDESVGSHCTKLYFLVDQLLNLLSFFLCGCDVKQNKTNQTKPNLTTARVLRYY